MLWRWSDLRWNCYASIFANLQQSYSPWLSSELGYHSISRERIDGIETILHMFLVDQIYVGITTRQCSQIYNTVVALDYCQNFVSAQYFGNRLMEFDQVLHMLRCWPDLVSGRYTSILVNFPTQLWLFVIVEISFLLNILPVKEITLYVKPLPTMCFMQVGRGVSNKHCLLIF